MAQFEIMAGDFEPGQQGRVMSGRFVKESAHGFHMPIKGKWLKTEHIPKAEIDQLEIATEESLKKMGGAIGWGLVGGLALGGIGAVAGLLAGGRSKEVTFACKFKDGRKVLGKCNSKDFAEIQAACF
jgi:hypothetical protein